MSMFRIFDISGSAMSAQSVRLNTTASNLANANTVASSADAAYRSRPRVQYVKFAGDYDHLARVKEWSAGGSDDE